MLRVEEVMCLLLFIVQTHAVSHTTIAIELTEAGNYGLSLRQVQIYLGYSRANH